MKLDFISHDKLTVAKVNMRAKGRDPDVGDIQPSIAKRGVLIPLLVRPRADAGPGDTPFEILAGRRRFTAVSNIVRDGGLLKVRSGAYPNRQAAQTVLTRVRRSFPDAFIVR